MQRVGQRRLPLIFAATLVTALAVLYLLPLYWMITGSFQPVTQTIKLPPEWFPANPTLSNYERLIFGTPALRWLLNSCIVALTVSLGATVTSTLAGFVFGILRVPGGKVLFWLVIFAMAIPSAATAVPLFLLMRDLGLIDTYAAMVLPHVFFPFGVFLITQSARSIPRELFDAARVDGAGSLKSLIYIGIPLLRPSMAAVAIFAFIYGWNDYLWQVIIVNDELLKTLPVGVATVIRGFETVDLGLGMSGATLAFIPMLIVFLAFQKYFIRGITAGALKG